MVCCSQVVDALSGVDIVERFYGFDLNNQALVNEQISNIVTDHSIAIKNINRMLLNNLQPNFSELKHQGVLVDFL